MMKEIKLKINTNHLILALLLFSLIGINAFINFDQGNNAIYVSTQSEAQQVEQNFKYQLNSITVKSTTIVNSANGNSDWEGKNGQIFTQCVELNVSIYGIQENPSEPTEQINQNCNYTFDISLLDSSNSQDYKDQLLQQTQEYFNNMIAVPHSVLITDKTYNGLTYNFQTGTWNDQ